MRRFKQGGFTLIELMVTVAIIGILAAIVYPSYTKYIVRAKRSAAQSFMLTVASRQETAMNTSYRYFSVDTGSAIEWAAVNISVPAQVEENYRITVAATVPLNGPQTFTVTATPTGDQAGQDGTCGNLTYDQAGTKGKSGPGSVAECWK